jgi:hypothetical protein
MHTMDTLRYAQATVRRVFIARCWAPDSRPMDCLCSDDVVHDVTIEVCLLCVGPYRGYV